MITIGSLFSGIGGLELGLERTGGFKTIWQCEFDDYASAVLKKHWPEVPNYGDITKVDWSKVERPDLVCGGFPCQDISTAGKGAGIKEGTRSGLWREFHKALRILRPKYTLVENVSALSFRGLTTVLGDLAQIGYNAEWFTLQAADVGAPHRRERLFIVCYTNHHGCAASEVRDSIDEGSDGHAQRQTQTSKFARPSKQPSSVAYTNRNEWGESPLPWRTYTIRLGSQEPSRIPNTSGQSDVTNTTNQRLHRQENEQELESKGRSELFVRQSRVKGKVAYSASFCIQRLADRQRERQLGRSGWWAVEPNMGRVANGVPSRVDRIKCLGNAVVPAVAEVIGQAILEVESQRVKNNEEL